MHLIAIIEFLVFMAIVTTLVKPVGHYLADVFEGNRTFLDPVLQPVESLTYKLIGIDPVRQMTAKQYAISFIAFGFAGTIVLYAILRTQQLLPWFFKQWIATPMTADLAFNTAVSFATTTTWQAYAGESTMSYLSQMFGLCVQNFAAAAAGLAVGIAFIRGLCRNSSEEIGNFWQDVVRSVLWIMLPLCVIGTLVLTWQGVPMNFAPYVQSTTLEGAGQIIPQGPVAALEFIKNLGTNGGGFFNANGAHPYENPTPVTNFVGLLAIVLLPASFTHTFGLMTKRVRDGWMLYWVMTTMFVCGLSFCYFAESNGTPFLQAQCAPAVSDQNSAPISNLEGKECRFGIADSTLAATVTSNGATGSYNSMHDSFTPIGGMVPLVNMLLGEAVYGGLGTGLYSLILWVLITVFIAGLMIGRTPEFIGNKLGPNEIKLVMLYTLASPLAILLLSALSVLSPLGLAALTTNSGIHGFTGIIYTFASSTANNGQNFAGLSTNNTYYNVTTAIAMLVGRFALAVPVLVLAGRFALQPVRQGTQGTLKSDTFTFASLVIVTIIVVGGLSYLPALCLGPVVEQMLMTTHRFTS